MNADEKRDYSKSKNDKHEPNRECSLDPIP